MSGRLHTVHVRVNDSATGQPTPVRIRFTSPSGEYHAPFGRLTEFATGPGQDVGGNLRLGNACYAYIDGACEIRLPAGPLTVEISKGPEYVRRCHEVTLAPGKMALRFTVERWTDLRESGWYSGDVRCHYLTPHAALLEAVAEDLAVVNVLAFEDRDGPGGHPFLPNLLAFSGQRPALEMPGHMVVVNTHNRHAVRGSLALLNCHRVVYPLRLGPPDGPDDWTLADWCDQCHRKGGLVIWTDRPAAAEEALRAGKVDAVETTDLAVPGIADWYQLLNAGLRTPLVGGSGKAGNTLALGEPRTYAHIEAGKEFSYKNWIEAIRAGRTFVSSGPLLSFTANGQGPGAVLDLPAESPIVQVRVQARSVTPFARLELVHNGQVIAEAAADSTASALLEREVPLAEGGWIAARCRGGRPGAAGESSETAITADTSPVYALPTSERRG